jgi:TatD DNase family protein
MIDSHCHFDLPAFDNKRDEIVVNVQKLGLTRILVPGLSIEQFTKLLTLQAKYALLDIAIGCHPYFLKQLSAAQLTQQMSAMAEQATKYSHQIVAIGECGLDASLSIPMAYQEQVLIEQIRIAKLVKKPLILHHRQSHNALIRALKQENFDCGGVIHAYSGSYETARTYVDLGFALGVGGTISYERAIKTRRSIKRIGLEHILLETDAPDMPISGYQGQDNSPERLPLIAKALSNLKDLSINEVTATTTMNYERVFAGRKKQ